MEGADEMFGGAVGDFYETVVYLGGARRVEGVCVEVQGTCLEGGLEDVGDVGEEDVVEEVAKLDGQLVYFHLCWAIETRRGGGGGYQCSNNASF